MDALFLVVFFSAVFIITMILAAILDWALYRVFGIRIFPRRYFKADKEVWKKW